MGVWMKMSPIGLCIYLNTWSLVGVAVQSGLGHVALLRSTRPWRWVQRAISSSTLYLVLDIQAVSSQSILLRPPCLLSTVSCHNHYGLLSLRNCKPKQSPGNSVLAMVFITAEVTVTWA